MQMDVLALIATIVFALIAIFLIPVLLQIKQTVQRFDTLIDDARRDILPLTRDLQEISAHLKRIMAEAETDVVKVRPVFDSLEQTGNLLNQITSALNSGVGRVVTRSIGTWMGVRAAQKAFSDELKETKRR
jgi:uncharacterized protein YoxC